MRLILALLLVGGALSEDDDCPDFDCPVKDGSFADPCTCRRYYACIDFRPVKQHCPSGLYWDDIKSKKCDLEACELPWCYCSPTGSEIPNGLELEETPQMVLIMLDGAVNQGNYPRYKRLFRNRTSANGCKTLGTFFLTHNYGNYENVEDLRHDGHEIAVSSITDDSSLYKKNTTAWVNELVGMRKILEHQAKISEDEILGVRAPGLTPGFNAQYEVLIDYGFIWDSSQGVPPRATPVWPYTYDYKMPHKCRTDSCPTRQFPGVWEIPLNSHYIEGYAAGHCPYLDQCVFTHMDAQDVLAWLKEDFNRHYLTNKAPYTLAMHTNWFQEENQRDALSEFLDWLEEKDDVFFVTGTQALLWMTDPKPLSQIKLVKL